MANLTKWSRSAGPAGQVAALGGSPPFPASGCARARASPRPQALEDRVETLHRRQVAADHQAIAALQAPDAAARAHVEIVDPFRLQIPGPPDVVDVVGVPPIDDGVVGLHS